MRGRWSPRIEPTTPIDAAGVPRASPPSACSPRSSCRAASASSRNPSPSTRGPRSAPPTWRCDPRAPAPPRRLREGGAGGRRRVLLAHALPARRSHRLQHVRLRLPRRLV